MINIGLILAPAILSGDMVCIDISFDRRVELYLSSYHSNNIHMEIKNNRKLLYGDKLGWGISGEKRIECGMAQPHSILLFITRRTRIRFLDHCHLMARRYLDKTYICSACVWGMYSHLLI